MRCDYGKRILDVVNALPEAGSVSGINVTGAKPGQTIKVKAVDENGKPTEWEAADFPEGGGATSWEDLGSTYGEGVVLAECSPEATDGEFVLFDPISLTVGNEYTVNWNGTPYKCVAQDFSAWLPGAVVLGDAGPIVNGAPTEGGEPFTIAIFPDEVAAEMGAAVAIIPLDGSESLVLSITGEMEIITPVPEKYLPQNGIVYEGPDNFLYKTAVTSDPKNLLTRREQKTIVERGSVVYVATILDDGEAYRPAAVVSFAEGRGAILVAHQTNGAYTIDTYLTPTDDELAEMLGT